MSFLEEDDAAFQADLAKAIAASLCPDEATDSMEADMPTGRPGAAAWGALLAAGRTSDCSSAPGGGATAGRSSPVLLLPAPGPVSTAAAATVQDDDDFQKQLAAAMAASIESVEEDHHRRKFGSAAASGLAGRGPALDGRSTGGTGSGALANGRESPFAAQAAAAACAETVTAAPQGLPPVGPSAPWPMGEGGAAVVLHEPLRQLSAPLPSLAPVMPAYSPTSSTGASAGGSAASSPSAAAAAEATEAWTAPAAATTIPRSTTAIAAAAAAAVLLSVSPGKHGRTPSHPGIQEAAQPQMKRSRPASDSGPAAIVSAFGGGAAATADSGAPRTAVSRDDGGRAVGCQGAGTRSEAGEGEGDPIWGDRCGAVHMARADSSQPTRPASAASGCTAIAIAEAAAATEGAVTAGDRAATSLHHRQSLVTLDLSTSTSSAHYLAHSLKQQQQRLHHQPPQRDSTDSHVSSLSADGSAGLRGAVAALDLSRPAAPNPLQHTHLCAAAAAAAPHHHAMGQCQGPASSDPESMAIDSVPDLPAIPTADGAAAADGTPAACAAAQPAPTFHGATDRRLLQHQRVWWWLGPGQAQLGRVAAIDRRSDPLLYTVRLDAEPAAAGALLGGAQEVIATADCLLPYVSYGERVMCRLLSPAPVSPQLGLSSAALLGTRVAAEGSARTSVADDCLGAVTASQDGSGAEDGCAQNAPVDGDVDDAARATPCSWAVGLLQHCVFDGRVPQAHVHLQMPYGLAAVPYTLPYELIVPVADAAEGSGSSSSSSAASVFGGGIMPKYQLGGGYDGGEASFESAAAFPARTWTSMGLDLVPAMPVLI